MALVDTVLRELRKLPASRGLKIDGGRAWIKCPRHNGGNENTPSLSINLDPVKAAVGAFKCFACGDYKGNFNRLAEDLRLTKLTRKDFVETEAYPLTDPKRSHASSTIILPRGKPWAKNREWRTIKGELLYDLGCISTRVPVYGERLVTPVHIHGELMGWIVAGLEKGQADPTGEKEISYIFSPGKWVSEVLFPFDYVLKHYRGKPIHLVEGKRDALNFLQHQVPALALLGANNWCPAKRQLLMSLSPKAVLVTLDPDEAGQKGAEKIIEDLKSQVRVFKIGLPRGLDPGAMTKHQINRMAQSVRTKLDAPSPAILQTFAKMERQLGLS